MGAELYLGSHYFRDSYNQTNLMNLFGLSWKYDLYKFTEGGLSISPKEAKRLLKTLRKREKIFEKNLKEVPPLDSAMKTQAEVQVYFREKYASFKTFLQLAIDENQHIRCSC